MSSVSDAIDDAVAALRRGDLVVYPTETVYGLGADALDERALDALVDLKGREGAKGISVLVPSLEAGATLVTGRIPDAARALATAFWPGPLTIVLAAVATLPRLLIGPGGGVGLRCSADPVARALVSEFGGPITSTSANPSGSPAATDIREARSYFGVRVASYVDGGERSSQQVSTVVEFFERGAILRRAGAIPAADLAAVLPRHYLEM